jgi:hypothetical protein
MRLARAFLRDSGLLMRGEMIVLVVRGSGRLVRMRGLHVALGSGGVLSRWHGMVLLACLDAVPEASGFAAAGEKQIPSHSTALRQMAEKKVSIYDWLWGGLCWISFPVIPQFRARVKPVGKASKHLSYRIKNWMI